jgi:hypothetical protein
MGVAPFFVGDDGGRCISRFVLRAPLCRVSETGAIERCVACHDLLNLRGKLLEAASPAGAGVFLFLIVFLLND